MWRYRPYNLAARSTVRVAWYNTCTNAAGQQNNNNTRTRTFAFLKKSKHAGNCNLTFVEAVKVEPLFFGTPHLQTPRFFRGIVDRIHPCQYHLLPRWISQDAAGRWNWSVPCWRPPNPARSSCRWWPTFSSSDTRILGPPAGLQPTPTSR